MLALFALAIFSSAFLLFLVQPMFSKVVLPFMGGGAAVWNTSVLFFQLVLLAGYLYAHVVSTRLGARTQVALHAALFAATLLLLPIEPKLGAPPPGVSPVPWLLGLLALSIGAPFLLLSTTGPLLQRWFSRAGHRDSANPYFLYSASNAGSLLALIAYPVVVEPWVTLSGQRGWWSVGYGMVAGLVVSGGWMVARKVSPRSRAAATGAEAPGIPQPLEGTPDASAPVAPPFGGRSRVTPHALHWIALAAIPSGLMLAVTTWMTTDVAPVPLLWVVPLALYLLSFILAFARRPRPAHAWWVARQPIVLVAAAVLLFFGDDAVSPLFAPFHLAAFFMTAMVCHGELARLRPPAERLTAFYLALAVGGALGGVFSAIVAPLVFDSIAEYPWLVVMACALLPRRRHPIASSAAPSRNDVMRFLPFAVALLALIFATTRLTGATNAESRDPYWKVGVAGVCGVMALALLRHRHRPFELALGAGLVLVAGSTLERERGNVVYAERNFYGERTVREVGPVWTLAHGTTTHGMQFADSARREIPLAYYHRGGPVGELFRSLPLSPFPLRVAVVGLGTGAIAAYGEAGDQFHFYEIDPAMVQLARGGVADGADAADKADASAPWFTYLRDSKATIRIILGDGRIRMAEAPDSSYDVILLDAFSSDAVPVHLLTREALAMFVSKLAPEGILGVHLSNRYLSLDRVVAAAAAELGVPARHRVKGTTREDRPKGFFGSSWAAMARDSLALSPLPPTWLPLTPPPGFRAWSDDYSNVLSVFRWRR